MRLTTDRGTRCSEEEVEIDPGVGLLHVVDVQPFPPAAGVGEGRDRRRRGLSTGEVGPRRVHLELLDALPDGIGVDADDHLWVAVWGAGELRRFAPAGGLVDCLRLPAPHTSSLAFAGADLRTLVVTTATTELSEAQMAACPDSGRLFTFRVDVPGLATRPWAGAAIF